MNTSLTCREGAEHMMEYVEGVLDAAVRQTIDAHLAGCPRCVAFVRSYVAVPSIVREATHTTWSGSDEDALWRALARRRR